MHQVFKSVFFNFEFMRILSMAPHGGADIAECLAAAGKIKDLDPFSWTKAWHTQAEKAEGLAHEAAKHGDAASARRAFMRSANYSRAAGYMLGGRPQGGSSEQEQDYVLSCAERAAANFRRGAALLPGRALPLEIPYEDGRGGITLPGYLYMPPDGARLPGRKVPVLVSTCGADSTQEELYFINALAPEAGYALLTFEGPGQGLVLRRHGRPMRPDWEAVVGRVLDHLEGLASSGHLGLDLDMDRVALGGASMGGYLALRGASDPRVKACVAMDPFYDMWDFASHHTSPLVMDGLWQGGWISTSAINGLLDLAARFSFQLRWELGLTQSLFGADSPAGALLAMKQFSLRGGLLERVKCPVFVSSASQSLYLEPGRDAEAILADLGHLPEEKKSLWVAREPEDGGLQAKVGAFGLSAQRTVEFLDKHFDIGRSVLDVSPGGVNGTV